MARALQHSGMIDRRSALLGLGAVGGCACLSGCAYNEALDRRQFVMVPEGQMAQLAAQTWNQIRREERPLRSAAAQRRVRSVGERLVRAAGENPGNWEYQAFASEDLNAFALPGGRIGIYEGILDLSDTDDELATVMGHEVAHVMARHGAERYSQRLAASGLVAAGSAALAASEIENSRLLAGVLGLGAQVGVLLPFSRKHELEADRLGVEYMHRAGYDPYAAISFWQKMRQESGNGGPPTFLSTHPAQYQRIEVIRREIRSLPPA